MEVIKSVMTNLGAIGESTITAISLSVIGLIGTFATVGYKYRKDKPKPEDQSKVIFDQVNEFIKQQKQDRDDLRKELGEVKTELAAVRLENQAIRDENQVLREENQELREELQEVKRTAASVAATKAKEK